MLKKILYNTEPLEINIKDQLDGIKKNKNLFIFKVFIRQIFNYIYFKVNRFSLMPLFRLSLSKVEKIIFYSKNFTKNFSSESVKKLGDNSFVKINSFFNEQELDKIIKYLSINRKLKPIYTSHQDFELNEPPIDTSTGYIDTKILLECPHIFKGANHNEVLDILNAYFNCKFKLDWFWSWWSFPSKSKIGPQNFHRDYESLNFIKVFVYLTNVDKKGGPHFIVKGSHKVNNFFLRKRFLDEDVIKKFNENSIVEICGDKGTTFMANTYALHKGMNPQDKKRLVLVYLYSVVPSKRSPKLPPVKLSQLDDETKSIVIKNKYLNTQFIDFEN